MLRASGKRWNLPLVCVEGELGFPLLGVSWNRFPFNVKFRFTIFGPMYSSMAVRADFWRFFFFFFSFLRAVPFSVQFSRSVVSHSCDPMNCRTPGIPVHHQLPEFTQTHVCRVGDAIQPSHPLSAPSPPAPNPSQHRGLFQ